MKIILNLLFCAIVVVLGHHPHHDHHDHLNRLRNHNTHNDHYQVQYNLKEENQIVVLRENNSVHEIWNGEKLATELKTLLNQMQLETAFFSICTHYMPNVIVKANHRNPSDTEQTRLTLNQTMDSDYVEGHETFDRDDYVNHLIHLLATHPDPHVGVCVENPMTEKDSFAHKASCVHAFGMGEETMRNNIIAEKNKN